VRIAGEENSPEALFQQADALAYSRRRDAQLTGGSGKTLLLGGGKKRG
jgi:hypothetical protein